MRVIAGTARSIPLSAPKGNETRPTTDKIKETLFNIIQQEIPGCVFLDLFAGSGAIGIEALSRGARKAVFVENRKDAAECICANVKKCHMEDRAVILKMDVCAAIGSLRREQEEDTDTVIFMDPPYDQGLEELVLSRLAEEKMIRSCDTVILEMSLSEEPFQRLSEICKEIGLEICREKRYKNQRHIFIGKAQI